MITVDQNVLDRFSSAMENFIADNESFSPGSYWREDEEVTEQLESDIRDVINSTCDDGTVPLRELMDHIHDTFSDITVCSPNTPIYNSDIREVFFENMFDCDNALKELGGISCVGADTIGDLMAIAVDVLVSNSSSSHVDYWANLADEAVWVLEDMATTLFGDNWEEEEEDSDSEGVNDDGE